jgi:hypothetical protein
MNKKLKTPDPRDFNLESFGDLVSDKLSIVGEEAGAFEVFRAGMLASLAPMTPYECVIAENLIAIEWELFQQRRMREASLRETARQAIEAAVVSKMKSDYETKLDLAWEDHIASGGSKSDWREEGAFDGDAALDAANDLTLRALASQPEIRMEAYAQIASLGLEPIDLMGQAYRDHSNQAHVHDQKIQNLERRRREVKRDLDDLQRVRPFEGGFEEI